MALISASSLGCGFIFAAGLADCPWIFAGSRHRGLGWNVPLHCGPITVPESFARWDMALVSRLRPGFSNLPTVFSQRWKILTVLQL